jgi:glyoxylase-like metal-dependent hydrolase (beta-lactamase superfamily II)
VHAVLTDNHLPTDKLNISFTPLVVNTGSKVILIDTGFADNGGPTNGRLVAQLKAAGIQPEQVDEILISHYHGDHISGLRAKDGKLVYPNAQIFISEVEWNHVMDDARMAAMPENARGGFMNARRVFSPIAADVKKFKWGSEPTTGITAIDASGHTPGHTAFVIASSNSKLMYVADTTNTPVLFARNPDWSLVFDEDGPKAVQTRRRILDMAAADKLQLSFYHANFPATGFVTRRGNGFDYVPASWNA